MAWYNEANTLLETRDPLMRRMRFLMGCFVEIQITGESQEFGMNAIEEAFWEMKRIEQCLSKFLPESTVSLLNRQAGKAPVRVPGEVFHLIEKAYQFSKLAEGAFDITVNPFIELWDLAEQRGREPTGDEIKRVSERVGYRHLILDPVQNTIFFNRPAMAIDLGAVGKGYAVDRAVRILQDRGIRKAVVTTGSSLYCLDDKLTWFGITHPLKPKEIATTVPLMNNSVSTSANYERFFRIGNKNYGHLIDPRTGISATSDVLSVSVVAGSAVESDLLSTAIFILGKEKGMHLIEKWAGAEAILITAGGSSSTKGAIRFSL